MGTHTVRHPVPESSAEGAKRSAGSECLIVEYSHVDSPCVSGCLGGLSVRERGGLCLSTQPPSAAAPGLWAFQLCTGRERAQCE